MFEKWGFLLSEIWVLLALAALVGLFAGWLIWARREVNLAADRADEGLGAELAASRKRSEEQAGRIAGLEAELTSCRRRGEDLVGDIRGLELALADCRAETARSTASVVEPEVLPVVEPAPVAAADPVADPAPVPVSEPPRVIEAARPVSLEAPREGGPDDLKLIKGVGPVLERLCHRLGYFHFDQIAKWTPAEIAWVDENLEGFKGRVTRDEWVVQARDLAAGLPPRQGGEG
ncbi:NADH-quinone oxidoreductase subunit E [Pseudogemmobacter sonorensis]|uniref:NADH-quinone oxidoreductase subunit E n=1 Tax=Pseudogemmobacter sonorensis TaxID=2989681 RepID=UPI0036AD6E05